jgi:hypothetical protein
MKLKIIDGMTPMFMDWQKQYCENGYITKGNLQIQWTLCKKVLTSKTNFNIIFAEIEVHMEAKRPQSNPEQKEQS